MNKTDERGDIPSARAPRGQTKSKKERKKERERCDHWSKLGEHRPASFEARHTCGATTRYIVGHHHLFGLGLLAFDLGKDKSIWFVIDSICYRFTFKCKQKPTILLLISWKCTSHTLSTTSSLSNVTKPKPGEDGIMLLIKDVVINTTQETTYLDGDLFAYRT